MISLADNFMWFGVVEDNEDPEQMGRIRVRIVGIHSDDKSAIPTDALPWANICVGVHNPFISGLGLSPTGLVAGCFVAGIFEDGLDMQQPLVLFALGGRRDIYKSRASGFNDVVGEYPLDTEKHDTNRLARGDVSNTPMAKTKEATRKKDIIVDNDVFTHPTTGAPLPAGIEKSGTQWVSRYMGSTSLDDCASGFREDAKAFVDAMRSGGISVSIAATYRPINRAYLMHYAAAISRGEANISNIPKKEGVLIDWAHLDASGKPNPQAAKKAAQAMVNAYGIGGNPVALNSNHTNGTAMDIHISNYNGKSIKHADDSINKVNSFSDLVRAGASWGIRWFGSGDKVHWSRSGR